MRTVSVIALTFFAFLLSAAGCARPINGLHLTTTGRDGFMYGKSRELPLPGEFHIVLIYGNDYRITADSQNSLIQIQRGILPHPAIMGQAGRPVIYQQRMSEDQRLGLARWVARFLAGEHPSRYGTRAPQGWTGTAQSYLYVNGEEVAWDNTADAPELKAEVKRLIDLTDGQVTIAGGFTP